jgi:hypothetical protein
LGRIGAAKVGIVNPPAGVAEGWDLADAEREGWTGERVLPRIREGVREPLALRAASGVAPAPDAPPAEAPAEARASPIEDDAAPFRALGH